MFFFNSGETNYLKFRSFGVSPCSSRFSEKSHRTLIFFFCTKLASATCHVNNIFSLVRKQHPIASQPKKQLAGVTRAASPGSVFGKLADLKRYQSNTSAVKGNVECSKTIGTHATIFAS
jgi:hypothetical protein